MIWVLPGMAQTPTTQGTEFWVSYMRNGHRTSDNDRLTLIVSGKHDCSGRVYNPNTNWEMPFQVTASNVLILTIPDNQGYNDQLEGVANKGLYVTSEDTISLYIGNEATNSYDAANVLPVAALGKDYTIQTNQSIGESSGHQGQNRASILVVATVDGTTVEITPSVLTHNNHPAGQPYTIQLNRGQSYHMMNYNQGSSNNHEGDLSGSRVVANQPVAVFNGNCLTCIPGGLSAGYDHVFDQAMPTDYWGRRFVVTSTDSPSYMNLGDDLVKVTALNDETVVTRDGQTLFTLNAGESGTFSMDLTQEPCTYLESNLPVAVYLYQHSHGNGSPAYGDPSMVWISPVEQTVYEVTFSTFQVQEVQNHYVNIVCPTENVSDITFDGQSIALNFRQVPGAPEYSYLRYGVNHGVHTIRCQGGGFIAHVYGIGDAEGYAYSVGSSAKQLTKQLYVDGVLASGTYSACQKDTLNFKVETNYEFHHVRWIFGDGTETNAGSEVSHAYPYAGDCPLKAIVYQDQYDPFDTISLMIQVHPIYRDEKSATTCADYYPFAGGNYAVPGDYLVQLYSIYGCDSIFELHVEQGNVIPYDTVVIACESFEWFGETYTSSNTYTHLVPDVTPEGCDSLYTLYLTIGHPPVHPERSFSSCNPYLWHGQYCRETRDYTQQFETPEHCVYDSVLHFTLLEKEVVELDTTVCDRFEWHGRVYDTPGQYLDTAQDAELCKVEVLRLTLELSPGFEYIEGPTVIAMSTSFWPGCYEYTLDDTVGLNTSSVHWELIDNPGWLLYPHGGSCELIATSQAEVVLHAWYDVETVCGKDVTLRLQCSGFGVEGQEADDLKLYPNPARDELTVQGEEMVKVLVFDMRGRLLKEIPCQGTSLLRVPLAGLAPGSYLLMVQTKKSNKVRCFSVIL